MTRILLRFLLTILIFPSLSSIAEEPPGDQPGVLSKDAAAAGTVTCRADLFYVWTKKAERESSAAEAEPFKTFFGTYQQIAAHEGEARTALDAALKAASSGAFQSCSAQHENQSACISRKLRESAGEYRNLDFARRRAFLEAVRRDCEAELGSCLKPQTGEVTCIEQRPVITEAKAEPASAPGKTAEKSGAAEPAAAGSAAAEAAAPPIPISLSGRK